MIHWVQLRRSDPRAGWLFDALRLTWAFYPLYFSEFQVLFSYQMCLSARELLSRSDSQDEFELDLSDRKSPYSG